MSNKKRMKTPGELKKIKEFLISRGSTPMFPEKPEPVANPLEISCEEVRKSSNFLFGAGKTLYLQKRKNFLSSFHFQM